MTLPVADRHIGGLDLEAITGQADAAVITFPDGIPAGTWTATAGTATLTVAPSGNDLRVSWTADQASAIIGRSWRLRQNGADRIGGWMKRAQPQTTPGAQTVEVSLADESTVEVTVTLNGTDGADGEGVPTGGTTGQVLTKATNADHDTEWTDPATGETYDDTIADDTLWYLDPDTRETRLYDVLVLHGFDTGDSTTIADQIVTRWNMVLADLAATEPADLPTATALLDRLVGGLALGTAVLNDELTSVAAALTAEATLARNADNLTSGTVNVARIPATIARQQPVVALSGSGSEALTLDAWHTLTTSGTKTLTLPSIPADGLVHYIDLEVSNGGSHTVNLPTVVWDNGTAVAFSGRCVLSLACRNGVTPIAAMTVLAAA